MFVILSIALIYGIRTAKAQTGNEAASGDSANFSADNTPVSSNSKNNIDVNTAIKVNLPDVKAKNDNEQTKTEPAESKAQSREKISANFMKLSDDLSGIADRIAVRADIMKKSGIDVSKEEDMVVKAKASIALAQNFATEIKTKTDAGDTLTDIKISMTSAKDALKEAHGYLESALNGLKDEITAHRQTETSEAIQ